MSAATGRQLPRGLPVVGHAPAFLRDKLGFLTQAAAYGSVVELRIGVPVYLLTDPGDIRHVLVTNHANYRKGERLTSPKGRRLSGHGLLTSWGEEHRRRRLVLQPLFHQAAVSAHAEVIVSAVDDLLAGWHAGREFDVAAETMRLAQRIILTSLYGERASDPDFVEAVSARRRYLEYAFLSLLPLRERLPTPTARSFRRAQRILDETLAREIRRRRDDPTGSTDLLSLLVAARFEDGTPMSDSEIRDEALTLSVTGYETLGDGLSWTLYLLSRHQPVGTRLRLEAQTVLGTRRPGSEDAARLPYAQQVFSEALRLYPPTWLFVRRSLGPDRLPSGSRLPAGAKLYLSPYILHRDARWFPEPEAFRPERFEPDAIRARPKHAYLPFGSGPHVCIGEGMARMEAALVLASIARRCRLAAAETTEPEPRMTLRPRGGIRLRIEAAPPRAATFDQPAA